MSNNQTMYAQNVYFPDAFKGCGFDCVYCVPSFQRQAKRQKQRCQLCYEYRPHFHPERLYKPGKLEFVKTPATTRDQFIFFPKGGDPCFATEHVFKQMLAFINYNSQTTFLMQTKDPDFLRYYPNLPSNLILGITLESDKDLYETSSKFKRYSEISRAPTPVRRAKIFCFDVFHKWKFVTIEPILQFNLENLVEWILTIDPEAVYIGYDTKNCHLPEPTLQETKELIGQLESWGKIKRFDVRLKTIRKAWWEQK